MITLIPLNPDEATGFAARDDIYLSLTKEVAVRHNGKTDRNRTKRTTSNVLQQLRSERSPVSVVYGTGPFVWTYLNRKRALTNSISDCTTADDTEKRQHELC
jgi:hypothetical protein